MKRMQLLAVLILLSMVLGLPAARTVAQSPPTAPAAGRVAAAARPDPRTALPAAPATPQPAPEHYAWQYGPASPFEYQRHDAVFVPGLDKVYFLGGRISAPSELPDIWVFDPVTGVYTDTGANMIEDVSNYNSNLIMDDGTGRGPAVYVIGGYDKDGGSGGGGLGMVQRYYPQLNVIEALPPTDDFPGKVGGYTVAGHGTAVVGDLIYVFGGWASNVAPYFLNQTWLFDPNQPSGSRWTDLNIPFEPARTYIQAAVQGGKIYAMGGISGYVGGDLVPTDVVQVLDTNNLSAGWVTLAPLPLPLAEGRGFGFDADTLRVPGSGAAAGVRLPPWFMGRLYTAGGGDWPDITREAMEYYVGADAWDQNFPDLNDRRVNNAGTFIPIFTPDPSDGLPGLWVFGGRSENGCDPPYGATEFYPLPVASSCSVLLVDDDWDQYQGQPYNGTGTYYYTSTLEALGYSYTRWDVWTQGDPTLADLQGYDAVIWFTGYAWQGTITPTNEADLAAYLDGGGNLFLSGEDYLHDQGVSPFAALYLGVTAAEQDVGEVFVQGTAGDLIGDGLGPYMLIPPTSWPSGTVDLYTDELSPRLDASVPFYYQLTGGDSSTGLDAGLWRTVFLAWPLEGLSDLSDRTLVLGRALDWFCYAERPAQLSLLPPQQSGSGARGTEVAYALTLVNNTGLTDTFYLDYAAVWPVVGPSAIGPLPAGSSYHFAVTVTVSPDSGCGDVDTAVITASSTLSPTVYWDAATIDTTSTAPGDGALDGTVSDANTGLGIPGAHVFLTQGATYTETWADAGGYYLFPSLPACDYAGGADAPRYGSAAFTATVLPAVTTTVNPVLPAPWPEWLPDTVAITLTAGDAGLVTATLANSGTSSLLFTITEVPSDVTWLAVDPPAGTVAPAASADIRLLFDSSGLAPADCYYGTLQAAYNDPYLIAEFVPLRLCVLERCEEVTDVDFTWAPPTPTVDMAVLFTATVAGAPTPPVTFTWAFGDGGTAVTTATTVPHTYMAVGAYSVTVAAANACGQAAAERVVLVVSPATQWRVYLPIVYRGQ